MCAGVQQHGPVRGEVGGAGQVMLQEMVVTLSTLSTLCQVPRPAAAPHRRVRAEGRAGRRGGLRQQVGGSVDIYTEYV